MAHPTKLLSHFQAAAFFLLASSLLGAPSTFAQVNVRVRVGSSDYDQAANLAAYSTITIVPQLNSGATLPATLNAAWRAEIEGTTGADVKEVTWNIIIPQGSRSHPYALWPPVYRGSISNSSAPIFELITIPDKCSFLSKKAAQDVVSRKTFQAIDEGYQEFCQLCQVSPAPAFAGRNLNWYNYVYCRELCVALTTLRSPANFSRLSQPQKNELAEYERKWRRDLAVQEIGYSDRDSVSAFIAATDLWLNYATRAFVNQSRGSWASTKCGDNAIYRDPAHAQSFREDLASIFSNFQVPGVYQAINAKVQEALASPSLSRERRLSLEIWARIPAPADDSSGASPEPDYSDFTFGQLGVLITELYRLFPAHS